MAVFTGHTELAVRKHRKFPGRQIRSHQRIVALSPGKTVHQQAPLLLAVLRPLVQLEDDRSFHRALAGRQISGQHTGRNLCKVPQHGIRLVDLYRSGCLILRIAVIGSVMFDHRGIDYLDSLSFMIEFRLCEGTEVSGLAVIDGMVFIVLNNVLIPIHLQGCRRPVNNVLSGTLVIDELRRPGAARSLRRDLCKPRIAPVHKVVGLPHYDAVASVCSGSRPGSCLIIGDAQIRGDHIEPVALRRSGDKVIPEPALAEGTGENRLVIIQIFPVKSVLAHGKVGLFFCPVFLGSGEVDEQITDIILFRKRLRFRLHGQRIGLGDGLPVFGKYRRQRHFRIFRLSGHDARRRVRISVLRDALRGNDVLMIRGPRNRYAIDLRRKADIVFDALRIGNREAVRHALQFSCLCFALCRILLCKRFYLFVGHCPVIDLDIVKVPAEILIRAVE